MTSSYNLEGKVAIVTGSSSGIGEAIALLFARSGARVTICGRNTARLESVKTKCQKASGQSNPDRFLVVQGDQNDTDVRSKTIQDTVQKFGQLDIVVANAGEVNVYTTFENETEEGYDKCFNTMLKSPVFLLQEAAPFLEKTKGVIVIISSPSSTCCIGGQIPYCMTKASVDALTRTLALGLGPKGIRVNAIRPGFVATKIIRDFCPESDEDGLNAMMVENSKLSSVLEKRVSTADEQADVVGFLASDASSFVTGETILTDGASSLQCQCFIMPSQS